jgi:hypothetical protein
VRIPYRQIADLTAAVDWPPELEARTVVLEVEPLVAGWGRPLRRLLFR